MDAIKQISYTIKDIYNLPEGKRAELINGQIYMMAPPSTKHQKLISALHGKIYNSFNHIMETVKLFLRHLLCF